MEIVLTIFGIAAILLLILGFIYQYKFGLIAKYKLNKKYKNSKNDFELRELGLGNEEDNNTKYD